MIHGLCARGRGEGEEIYLLLLAFIKNQNYWNILHQKLYVLLFIIDVKQSMRPHDHCNAQWK